MAKAMVVNRDDLKEQAEDVQAALAAHRAMAADLAQDAASRVRPGWEQLQEAIGSLTDAAMHSARDAFVRSGAADVASQLDGETLEHVRATTLSGLQQAKERLGPHAQEAVARANEQADRLRPKAVDLSKQTRERTALLASQARERAADLADRARDQAADLSDRAGDVADRASDRAGDLSKQAKEWLVPAAATLAAKAATVASKTDELLAHREELAEEARSRVGDLGSQARESVSAVQVSAGPAIQRAAGDTTDAIGGAFDATGRAVRSTVNNIFWIILFGGLAVLLYAPKDEEREKLFAEAREWVTYAIDLFMELRGGK